ncbi:hypothetical protein NC651_005198 [Populus alba x Populus x berolinensis]|nr:hypothetical protein NC651_005198 [Populus alba x Populus x berolinensis]
MGTNLLALYKNFLGCTKLKDWCINLLWVNQNVAAIVRGKSTKELLPCANMTAEKTRSNRLDNPEKKLITAAYSLLPILSENMACCIGWQSDNGFNENKQLKQCRRYLTA